MPDGSPAYRNESLAHGAKTAAPAINAALATLTTPPAGYYRVEIWCGLSGTVGTVDASNFEFRKGSTVMAVLAVSGNGTGATASNTANGPYTLHVNLDGATSITVNATAGATASSVYHCTMIATRLN
ncbi:hypothetical protein AS594_07130 [Streptomyces agglomeratus]|uniref:Uncharacterized protein n=1 Tax=Streptomyces agglomeratus TaxID=285458 RepID=A0A1E5P443_9ACTN|nr:hypothetical protein [Streptomyces agglomeratus]OEJ24295.1 hypothetical protein AS594_07130 [Streptomyces agglomeratus]